MAIYIQQSAEEVRRSFSLQRRAEIISVRLIAASINAKSESDELGQALSVTVGQKCTPEAPLNHMLSTNIEFTIVASPESDDAVQVFAVKCTLRVTYQLEENYEPAQDEIEAFSSANAVFNAWPFFREFAQNTIVRMGFPGSPTLPFLKLVPKPEVTPNPEGNEDETAQVPRRARKPRKSVRKS